MYSQASITDLYEKLMVCFAIERYLMVALLESTVQATLYLTYIQPCGNLKGQVQCMTTLPYSLIFLSSKSGIQEGIPSLVFLF